MSQRTFKVVNRSEHPISYAVKMHATHEQDLTATFSRLEDLGPDVAAQGSVWHSTTKLDAGGGDLESPTEAGEEGPPADPESEDEETILSRRSVKQHRAHKATRRDIVLDRQLFGDKNFKCVPAEGSVPPRSEMEVVVQFTPDYARDYEVVAYVDLQGRTERLPITLKAKGLVSGCVLLAYMGVQPLQSWIRMRKMGDVEAS
jgi:hypothetical protein